MDLFGPTSYVSIGGNTYCLMVVDDYSRFTWVLFLHEKSNVFGTIKSFTILAQNQFENDIRKVRSDNGSEFKNARVDDYCDGKCIKHEFSSKYTPKQNGIVEMKNMILLIWLGLCLHNIMYQILFGPKPSIPLFMHQIDYIVINS
jgi:transposase InsO family protein